MICKEQENLLLGPEVYKEQLFFLGMSEIFKKLEEILFID